MRWIEAVALLYDLGNMPTIGKVMDQIQDRLEILGEASGRTRMANAWGFHRNKKLKLQDSCEFHPSWPFGSSDDCTCFACGDRPHVDYLSPSPDGSDP